MSYEGSPLSDLNIAQNRQQPAERAAACEIGRRVLSAEAASTAQAGEGQRERRTGERAFGREVRGGEEEGG